VALCVFYTTHTEALVQGVAAQPYWALKRVNSYHASNGQYACTEPVEMVEVVGLLPTSCYNTHSLKSSSLIGYGPTEQVLPGSSVLLMKLHLLSKKVIQSGLPAIVLLLPVLVNPFGCRFYEIPKVAFLRFTVLLVFTAWLVARISIRGPVTDSLRRLLSRPLVLPVFLFTLAYVLSTITSVAPHVSFWGSYFRVSGTCNALCYAIFFLLIVLNLHTTRQVEQLITVTLLASLPIALYGVLQHSGFDPIFPQYDHSSRVISTIGNPIFLGAYLIMVTPLAFGRLLISLRALLGMGQSASSHHSMFLEVAGYSSLLLLQLTCLLYTKARGPWFGLLGGALLFAILITLRHGMKKLLLIATAVGAAVIVLLVALNLPNTPLEPFTESPYLSRLVFSDELAAGTGTSWVRLYIWQGTLELIRSNPNIGFAPDPFRPLRLFIGYGPETMRIVFPQVYPPELAHVESREAMADRAHNELLDLVVTTGVLGLLAFLLLIGCFFYYGISLLRRTRSFSTQVSLIALLSAMFAHLIEAQFGILLFSAELLLWLYLALMSVMYHIETATAKEEDVYPIESLTVEASADNTSRLQGILSLLVVCVIPFFASLSSVNLLLADTFLARGRRFQASGQWKESITAYNQAIQAFPDESKFYAFKADAHFQLAQSISDEELEARGKLLQTSADALAKAREIGPLEPMYYGDTAKLYTYWAKKVDPSKFKQAVDFYEQVLQLCPRDAVYRNELARVYFDTGRYEEAIQQLQLSLEIDPKFYATHYNLGLAYLKLGEKDRAREHFETGLLLDPACVECAQQLESLEGD
jgi:O-antigen ligase/predicted negative regulator of RcsB-dependent stress response